MEELRAILEVLSAIGVGLVLLVSIIWISVFEIIWHILSPARRWARRAKKIDKWLRNLNL